MSLSRATTVATGLAGSVLSMSVRVRAVQLTAGPSASATMEPLSISPLGEPDPQPSRRRDRVGQRDARVVCVGPGPLRRRVALGLRQLVAQRPAPARWAVESKAWACDSAIRRSSVRPSAPSAAPILVCASSSAACARSSLVCILAKEIPPPAADIGARAALTAATALSTAVTAAVTAVLAGLAGSAVNPL